MRKNALKTVLFAIMALTLVITAACNNGKSGNSDTTSNESGETSSDLKPVNLVVAFPMVTDQKDMELVQNEISKITKEKINATVKLVPIGFGAYSQQKTLMLSSNEQVDLMISGLGTHSQDVAKGLYVELDDLLEKKGKGIKDAFETTIGSDILNAVKIKGKTYGIPVIRNMAQDISILMRKDLVEKYKIDASKIKTLDDLDPIFKIIKENEPNITPIAKSSNSILTVLNGINGELLGDGTGLSNKDPGLKVVNWFETEENAYLLNTVRRWYQAGYIDKDSATSTETGFHLMKAGKAFSYPNLIDPWFNEDSSTGRETVVVHLKSAPIATSSINSFMWSMAKNTVNQERAMMLLELMYTDKDVVNLLNYGIEGKHYVKVSDDIIDFPEGVNASNSSYFPAQVWMFGNSLLSYHLKGEDPEVHVKAAAATKNALKSKVLGFNFDSEPVRTEIAAVTNVMNQYQVALETGMIDPATKVPDFNKQLKAAGMDKIIAEKQKQLDAWAVSNK
ncbi:ABC transporter substrate-binding protein [Paenibacillus luteus]|uniref:ABC transporter substrate-binding protein n=1 Tax=Paenibacillus luteus TaxID=2545753 RepID=UPI001144F335|nr:ABC transporter substrate-binding protein [Paenibacillus luteus]